MNEAIQPTANGNEHKYLAFALLACLLLRLLHLASAVNSPFTYHLGPDEEYYLQFGLWIAGMASGTPDQFAFMDPAYGYIVGLVFNLAGHNPLVVLLIQVVVDTITCGLIFLVGRELGFSRAGLIGAIVYALTATAIMYTATFLKATWVANTLMIWCWAALLILRLPHRWSWMVFGLFCGYMVALRGNLILLAALSILLIPWLSRTANDNNWPVKRSALLVAGMLVPLLLLSVRNADMSGKFAPLPNNGGTVLHQVYNHDNPAADSWYPDFAPYTNPVDIQRGYAAEAERRSGREMTPSEVDTFWRSQALDYIGENPGAVVSALARKTAEFASAHEVANNRALTEEKMYSDVLGLLPAPFGILFVLGIPGLVLLCRADRRGWIVVAPLAVVLATFAVFFAEARFRFHAVPLLVLGSGIALDRAVLWFRAGRTRSVVGLTTSVLVLGVISASATRLTPASVTSWDAIAWGFIKMGDLQAAARTIETAPSGEVGGAKWEEARGFIAWQRQDLASAIEHYSAAVQINNGSHVAHYNLAQLYQQTGDPERARTHATLALQLAPLPEYRALVENLGGS